MMKTYDVSSALGVFFFMAVLETSTVSSLAFSSF